MYLVPFEVGDIFIIVFRCLRVLLHNVLGINSFSFNICTLLSYLFIWYALVHFLSNFSLTIFFTSLLISVAYPGCDGYLTFPELYPVLLYIFNHLTALSCTRFVVLDYSSSTIRYGSEWCRMFSVRLLESLWGTSFCHVIILIFITILNRNSPLQSGVQHFHSLSLPFSLNIPVMEVSQLPPSTKGRKSLLYSYLPLQELFASLCALPNDKNFPQIANDYFN